MDREMDRETALKLLKGGEAGVREWNRYRGARPRLDKADLRMADLRKAVLRRTHLRGADLSDANLRGANLRGANLIEANLRGAMLIGADLSRAKLSDADLRGADLIEADLSRANVSGADLGGARVRWTIFSTNLSGVQGLESIKHLGRSTLNVNSVLQFIGALPEAFLRGCGLAEEEIAHFRSRVGSPIRFYSCFISYSSRDEEFASRLHNDLQAAGIRCWKWDHDARTGRSLWSEIDQAISVHDKLVLVASKSSLKSPAVNREIERAIRQEDRRLQAKQAGKFDGDVDVLFPVQLDDFIFNGWEHERKVDVTKKVIADARGWDNDPKVYARVRDRLIADLNREGKTK